MSTADTGPRAPAPSFHPLDPRRPVDRSAYTSAAMPPFPARTLLLHCLAKGCEWSVLGLALWPLYSRARARPLAATFRPVFLSLPAAGVAATFALLAGRHQQGRLDAAGVDDRAFRIAAHEGQNAVDRRAGAGALAGAAAGALVGGRAGRTLLGALASASFGAALGVAWHGVQMPETRAGLARARAALDMLRGGGGGAAGPAGGAGPAGPAEGDAGGGDGAESKR